MTASQSIRVSITPRQSQATWPKVYASQYDKGSRTVYATITDGTGTYSIPAGATITVRGTKPDKTGYEYACTQTGTDTVDFVITDQMTVLAGQHAAEIRITDSDGNIIGTGNFWLVIDASALSADTAVSETELPLIEKAAENSTTAQAAADTAKTAAETAQTAAESASKSAQTAQENAGKVLGAATLVEALTAETQRAKKAEEANAAAIDTETANRKAADESLQKALDAEITRAKAAEGGADITAEATARQTADEALQKKLDTETSERKAADDTASQAIDALNTTLNKTIDDRIAEVVGGAPESFDTLKEISDWISNNETSAAAMSGKISDNANAISGEVTRATAAEQTLTDNLNAEVTRAEKAEADATKAVSDETVRAEAAEKANSDAITQEVTDRKAADKTLQSNIDAEVTRAKQAEKDNADNLATETTRAEKAETANSDAITALQTKVDGLKLTAANVTYNNIHSGLTGATVQDAIDELKFISGGSTSAETVALSMDAPNEVFTLDEGYCVKFGPVVWVYMKFCNTSSIIGTTNNILLKPNLPALDEEIHVIPIVAYGYSGTVVADIDSLGNMRITVKGDSSMTEYTDMTLSYMYILPD